MDQPVRSGGGLAVRLAYVDKRLGRFLALADRAFIDNRIWAIAVAGLFLLQFWLIFNHRPWLDEWQALQIAVQSPTLSDLLLNLRYEGHPPPWYLALRWFSSLTGQPLLALPIFAAVLAGLAQSALLFTSPLRRFDRLMVAASQSMLFEFFTLSRSLTLGVTCAILAMAVWRRGNLAWLFIAFLPLCDFMFGVISAALVYLRWRERKAPFSLIGLWLCAGLVSASTVRPASDIVPALILHSPLMDLAIWMSNLSTVGLPLQWSGLAPVWNNPPPLPVAGLALCAFLFVCFTETRTRRDDALVLWGIMAVTLVFSIAVYPLAARHLMLIGLILILLIWHRIDTWGPQPGQAFRAWLLAAAACGLSTAVISCVKPFDTAAQAAAEIRHHGLEGKNWMAFPDSSGQGVAAINGMLFERTDDRCVQDFVRWNHKSSPAIWKGDGLYREFARKVREDGRFYLLSDFILTEQPPLLRRLSVISAGYDGQKFALYVVGEDHPDSTTLHRRCNGPALPFPRP